MLLKMCCFGGKVSVCFIMASGWFTIKKAVSSMIISIFHKLSYKAGSRLFQDFAAQMSFASRITSLVLESPEPRSGVPERNLLSSDLVDL